MPAFGRHAGRAHVQQPTNGNAQPCQAHADKAKQLGNITVTAQSRTQEMEQVPIPLQIITAKQIDTLAATDLSKMSCSCPAWW
jgi:iron complex outermembrane receptor protein